MATHTSNLGLTLPSGTEKVSRSVINTNNSIIDAAVGKDQDLTSTLTFDGDLSYTQYTYLYKNNGSKLVCLQLYFLANADVAANVGIIGNIPLAKNSNLMNFTIFDVDGGIAKGAYIDVDNTMKVRGGITNGHTYVGTVVYISN